MKPTGQFILAALPLALLVPGVAQAAGETAQTEGSAKSTIVEPLQVVAVDDLRFGQILQPAANGFLRVDPDGTITPQNGVVGQIGIAQTGTGRGPASFQVYTEVGRSFRVTLPNFINVTNGPASMRVQNFRTNVPGAGAVGDETGVFTLLIGARLRVLANQAVGYYSGTFDVTVTYN